MLTSLFTHKKQNPTNPNKQKTHHPPSPIRTPHTTTKNKQGTSQHLPIKKNRISKNQKQGTKQEYL
jgi:hypothetical protein